ncbi:MAG: hypothetical protein KDA21_13475 [Phycisphaerales bacterium]|nr:hypothetical protein [Phycisphaerales bacterium]
MTDEHPNQPEKKPEVYELEADEVLDTCPSCGKPWPSEDAVVCMHCGLNLRTNEKLAEATPDAPAVELEEPPPPAQVCHKGWLSWKVTAGIAGGVLLIACIMNGMTIPLGEKSDAPVAYSWMALVHMLLFVVLATGLGVFAILLTARMTNAEVGDLRHGIARIGLALALAAAVWALPWFFFASSVLYVIGAALMYGGAMWVLFRQTPDVPRKVLPAMHLMMLIVLSLITLI